MCNSSSCAPVSDRIHWPSYLARCDMLWDCAPQAKDFGNQVFCGTSMTKGFLEHLNEPAARALTQEYTAFDYAPFLGNGTMGMMLWQNEAGVRFEISRSDAYDRREGCPVLYGQNRTLNGYYQLTCQGTPVPNWQMRLHLWNAELTGTLRTSCGGFHLRAYVHALQNLLVLQLTPFGQERVQLDFVALPCMPVRPILRGETIEGLQEYPAVQSKQHKNMRWHVQRFTNRKDGQANENPLQEGRFVNACMALGRKGQTHTFYIATGFANPDAAQRTETDTVALLESARKQGLRNLKSTHRAWWHAAYRKSFVSLPEAEFESFYWIQLYKGLSAARKNSTAIDNFGPWFRPSGWSALWTNLNVQMAYSLFPFAGHADITQSLAALLHPETLAASAKHPALEKHTAGSMALPCIVTPQGPWDALAPPQGKCTVRTTLGNLPYCLLYLWDAYAVSMDKTFLQQTLFPLLCGALLYYECYLYKGKDEKLHLPYSWSPEWPVNTKDSNFELALLRWTCRAIKISAHRLGITDSVVQRAQEIETQLAPFVTDETQGLLVGENEPYALSHRHWSHLFAIYPTGLIGYTTEENKRLIDNSLRQYMALQESYTGFSWVAIASLYAACKKGNEARENLLRLLQAPFLWPNTMYTEMEELEWPTLETPMGVARTLQEMLLQSGNGVLEPFAAIPDAWQDVCFSKLLAHGGFAVSGARKQGKTQWVLIESLCGEPCRMSLPGPMEHTGNKNFSIKQGDAPGAYEIEQFAKGDWILFFQKGFDKNKACVKEVKPFGTLNAWGGRKQI